MRSNSTVDWHCSGCAEGANPTTIRTRMMATERKTAALLSSTFHCNNTTHLIEWTPFATPHILFLSPCFCSLSQEVEEEEKETEYVSIHSAVRF